MELNLPHHLNMMLHYLVNALSTSYMWNRWPSVPRNTRLFRRTCGIQISQIWTQSITRSGLPCNILSTRQKSVAWMNGGWSTSGVALNSRLSTWLLTTSAVDFERASIRKEDNSNTICELTILILSVSVTFSVTFAQLLPCYIFHSKSVPATSTIRPTRVFALQVQRQNQGMVADFILRLGADICCLTRWKKLLKLGSNCQSYSKFYRGTLFDSQFHVYDALSAFTR